MIFLEVVEYHNPLGTLPSKIEIIRNQQVTKSCFVNMTSESFSQEHWLLIFQYSYIEKSTGQPSRPNTNFRAFREASLPKRCDLDSEPPPDPTCFTNHNVKTQDFIQKSKRWMVSYIFFRFSSGHLTKKIRTEKVVSEKYQLYLYISWNIIFSFNHWKCNKWFVF